MSWNTQEHHLNIQNTTSTPVQQSCRKVAGALHSPNGLLTNLCNPQCVMKADFSLVAGSNPDARSSVENRPHSVSRTSLHKIKDCNLLSLQEGNPTRQLLDGRVIPSNNQRRVYPSLESSKASTCPALHNRSSGF